MTPIDRINIAALTTIITDRVEEVLADPPTDVLIDKLESITKTAEILAMAAKKYVEKEKFEAKKEQSK